MSTDTGIRLFAPPIMAALGFVMSLGRARDKDGNMDQNKVRFLIRMWLVLLPVAYVLVSWKEVSAFIR